MTMFCMMIATQHIKTSSGSLFLSLLAHLCRFLGAAFYVRESDPSLRAINSPFFSGIPSCERRYDSTCTQVALDHKL